jgi:hypothetical protein
MAQGVELQYNNNITNALGPLTKPNPLAGDPLLVGEYGKEHNNICNALGPLT